MTAKPLPTFADVGPYRYVITEDELERLRLQETERSSFAGVSDHDTLRIVINGTLAPGAKRDAVFHEVLHAVAATIGFSHEWGSEKEETIVQRLSPILLDVLRRNPTLVAYLTAEDA